MGTKFITRWIPIDAYLQFSHEVYNDLEDSDDEYIYKMAQATNFEREPSENEKEASEATLREALMERANDNLSGYSIEDFNDYTLRIEWARKEILVCEYCKSTDCDGDPSECEDAPEYCEGCDDYTGHECDCVWCDDHEQYDCDQDHEDDDYVATDVTAILKEIGFMPVQLKVTEEKSEEEEETVL